MCATAHGRQELPLADLAHALIEVESFEAFASSRGVSVALPGHGAEPVNNRLYNRVAGLGGGHRSAARRPTTAGGDSHGCSPAEGDA